MPSPSPHDEPALAMQRAAQADPWVMYLVVRRSTAAGAGEVELLEAAAAAAIACEGELGSDPAFTEAFAAWRARSFRKVVLRAREGEWARLIDDLAASVVAIGGQAGLACLPPRLRSEREPLLAKFQVFDPPAPDDDGSVPAPAAPAGAAELVVNGGLAMSLGKRMAQVAHGALMIEDRVWQEAGRPVSVRVADAAGFARAAATADAVVRDAGLTEVAPGSLTVAVRLPCRTRDSRPARESRLGQREGLPSSASTSL